MSALNRTESDDPFVRLCAMCGAYIHWAIHNPVHFRVISDISLIDFEGSELLCRQNEEIRTMMDGLLAAAPTLFSVTHARSFAGRTYPSGVFLS